MKSVVPKLAPSEPNAPVYIDEERINQYNDKIRVKYIRKE